MLIQNKIGNLSDYDPHDKVVDWLVLEWHETRKRIFRKQTAGGKEISAKFLDQNPDLTEGDVLLDAEDAIIAVTILPCDCIAITPDTMFEMASVCYEIGNKHLPLFYENGQLLVPFDAPLMRLLSAQGYKVKQEQKKLLQPLRTTVSPHQDDNTSLFSKIMKLTNPS